MTSLFDLGPWKELLTARVTVKFKKPSVFDDVSKLFNGSYPLSISPKYGPCFQCSSLILLK